MIARFYALLPYFLTIPEGERFTVYSYTDNGYEVRVYPPLKTDNPAQPDNVEDIQINGLPAFRANTLRIDFVKDSFDRRQGIECDPPYEFIRRTVNSLLSRLRFVTRGFQVKPLDFLQASHQIRYLNDDETELPSEEGLVRGHGAIGFHLSWTAVNAQIWDEIHQLSPYYIPPVWDDLLLDATHVLPEVGPSIVLAATALEVFISYILDELAKRSSVPQELWIWLTNRDGDWLKQPAVQEQFDTLLCILVGTSLKEDSRLWDAFTQLRRARNSFVHEGIAKIGNLVLTHNDARRLIPAAVEIIRFIREQLPDDIQWPEYRHTLSIQVRKPLN